MNKLLRSWLAAALAGALSLYGGEVWETISTQTHKELPADEITAMVPEPDGRVWLCTMRGLACWQDGKLTPQPLLYNGKPAPFAIWCVYRDGPTDLWVGHEQGGSLITKEAQRPQNHHLGAVARYVRMGKEQLWCVAVWGDDKKQVQSFDGQRWLPLELVDGRVTGVEPPAPTGEADDLARRRPTSAGAKIVDLYTAPDQRVWLTVDGDGVIEVDPAKGLDHYVHHLRKMNVTCVFEDSKKNLWFGLWGRGVAHWDGKDWQFFLENKLKRCAVMRIREDRQGAIMVGTNARGLWTLPAGGKDWTCQFEDAGSVTLLEVTSDGRVWLGAQDMGGLRVWDGKEWRVGLDSPVAMRCLAEAADGSVWVGGVLDGVHVLRRQ